AGARDACPTRRSSDLFKLLQRRVAQGTQGGCRLAQGHFAARLQFAETLLLIQGQLALRDQCQNAPDFLGLLTIPGSLGGMQTQRSEEHTSELQSRENL